MRLGANFCPGILHAVPARDGLLMRIRVPGGLIAAHQISTIADLSEEFADGTIEITSRANLQLRAIQEQYLQEMSGRIALAGMFPSPEHDRVRNIATSPFAGLDPDESLDTGPLIRQLDQRLIADKVFANLHPKFSFGIYSGSKRFSREVDDLALVAMNMSGSLCFSLWIDGIDSNFAAACDGAVDRLLEIARIFLHLAKQHDVPARARQVMAIPGATQHIKESLGCILTPCPPVAQATSFVETLPGVFPALHPGRVNIIPSVPLGRLTVEQGRYLAHSAQQSEADLRLTFWRGLVFGAVRKNASQAIVDGLHSVGLFCDGRGGFQGIAACAGMTGCDAALADVRGDAVLLARRLESSPVLSGWSVNVSGCEKQCGRRHGATAELIADTSGYILRIKGQPTIQGCSSEYVLDTIAELHHEMLFEVVSR